MLNPRSLAAVILITGFLCGFDGGIPGFPAAKDMLAGITEKDIALSGDGTTMMVDVQDQPFSKAYRIAVPEKKKNAWDVTFVVKPAAAIEKDATHYLVFYARCAADENSLGVGKMSLQVQKATAPYGTVFFAQQQLDRKWRRFSYPFTAKLTLDAGDVKIGFLLAAQKQDIEIGGISFVSYGSAITEEKIAALEKGTAASAQKSVSANLLPGDNSFETGTGNWTYFKTGEPLLIDRGNGYDGTGALRLKPNGRFLFCIGHPKMLKKGVPYVLSFYAKAAEAGTVVPITVYTPSWTWLGSKQFTLGTAYQRYELQLKPLSGDGTCNFMFGQGAASDVFLDCVQLEKGDAATAYVPSEPVSAGLSTGEPGDVVYEGSNITLRAAFWSSMSAGSFPYSLSVKDFYGREIFTASDTTAAGGKTLTEKQYALKQRAPGYYIAEVSVRDNTGNLIKKQSAPFLVVRAPRSVASEAFFGEHTAHVPLAALQRIGVKWVRDNGVSWSGGEAAKGVYTVAGKSKAATENYRKYGMELFNTIPVIDAPKWAQQEKGLPAPDADISGFASQIAEEYKLDSGTKYIEMQNEPDLTIGASKKLTPEQAAHIFADLALKFAPPLQKNGIKFVLNGSGVADENGSRFNDIIFERAANAIDVLALHPYSYPRYFGPQVKSSGDGFGLSPEACGMRAKIMKAKAFLERYPGKELWIGELGWGLDVETPFDSTYARGFAEYTARTILICASVPGVKRLFWFTTSGCIEGERYEYGLWRTSDGMKPLAAAAAYAHLAWLIDGATPLPPILDGALKAYAYQNGNSTIVAVWSANTEDVPLTVNITGNDARLYDMVGTERPLSDGPSSLVITGAPLLFTATGEKGAQLLKAVGDALGKRNPADMTFALKNTSRLTAIVTNNMDTAVNGTIAVRLAGDTASTAVRVDAKNSARIDISLAKPVPAKGARYEAALLQGNETILSVQRTLPPMLPCAFGKPGVKTANGVISLTGQEYIYPPDPTVGWKGVDDLSGRAILNWDDENFSITVKVIDDRHHQPFKGGDIWKGDSIQVAFDAGNNGGRGFDDECYEYGFALTGDTPLVWRWKGTDANPAGEAKKVRLTVDSISGGLLYTASIPWSELSPLTPVEGNVFGFNIVINDNDGSSRNFWAALTPGIADAKDPSQYKKFVLVK